MELLEEGGTTTILSPWCKAMPSEIYSIILISYNISVLTWKYSNAFVVGTECKVGD